MAPAVARARTLRAVGLTLESVDGPFFGAVIDGAARSARSINPAVRIDAVASAHDVGRQAAQIDDLVARGMDLIIVDPADHDALLPAIRRAQGAGVAVVAVHFVAGGVDAAVGTDDVAAGRLSCRALVGAIGGRGNVVIMSGPRRIAAVGDRVRGCREALAAHPAVTLLSADGDGGGSRPGGLALMADDLARYPAIAGVFAVSEPEALGAQAAITRADRRDIAVTTVGGGPELAGALGTPGAAMAATAALDPYGMGELAVRDGALILDGRAPTPRVTLMTPRLVDRDTVGAYAGWTRR